VTESVRPQIVFPGFKNQQSVEDFGQASLLKNIGLRIAKELYFADSN
jgi:hypothetical protein